MKRTPDHGLIKRATRLMLRGIGETGLARERRATPQRVADAWSREIVSGYGADPRRILARTMEARDHDLVLVRDIPFSSVCVHHLLPFGGTAHVAYVPDRRLVGLSKIARTVDALSRRLQLQERLTRQIAETLQQALRPLGSACVLEAEHLCMSLRGPRKKGARVVTTAYTGVFRSRPALRLEFLKLAGARARAGTRAGARR